MISPAINWNANNNRNLIEERHISFEEIVFSLQTGGLLDDAVHSNSEKYPEQRIFIAAIAGYAYLVPYAESDEEIFFKTAFPARKATKEYSGERS